MLNKSFYQIRLVCIKNHWLRRFPKGKITNVVCNYVLLFVSDDVVQQFVDEFEPPTMAVQPGPSKPKAKSDGSSSELEVIFDSEVTEQKTKNSTG